MTDINNETLSNERVDIIYNVTVKVDKIVAEKWLTWLQEEHAPEIIATKCFFDYRVMKILDIDDAEGPTYAVQYFGSSLSNYHRYINEYSETLRNVSSAKWGDAVMAFRTIMKAVK